MAAITARRVLAFMLGVAGTAAAVYAWRQRARRRHVQGRTVLITGGSRGLGLELARKFLAAGAQVALCARNQADLERARQQLAPGGGLVSIHVADISNPQAVERLVSDVTARWGRLDILVNNAGVFMGGPMALMRLDDYQRMLRVNLIGTITVTEACRPYLERHGGVITIVSAAGLLPAPHLAPYAVSKAGVSMYAQLLEVELASRGLETMAVYPSYMPTGSTYSADYRGAVAAEQRVVQRLMHMPFISVDHRRAGSIILNAWLSGRRVVVYPAVARFSIILTNLMPEFALRMMRLANRFYPTNQRPASGRAVSQGFE